MAAFHAQYAWLEYIEATKKMSPQRRRRRIGTASGLNALCFKGLQKKRFLCLKRQIWPKN